MINCTKLLCGIKGTSDNLRYGTDDEGKPIGITPSERRPIVVWNSTRRCNLNCIHCYADSKNLEYEGELTTDEAKRMIEDLAEFKAPVLLFSGGEPLIRNDIFELGKFAKNLGLRTVISTNGTLITEDVAKKIKEVNFSYVGISLDGIEFTNDKFRGCKGAFKKALDGIKNCKSAGVRVGLRLTLNKHNFNDLSAIFDLIENEGIPRVCFYHLVYSGRGSKLIEDDLSHKETREAVDLIFKKTKEFCQKGLDVEILTVDNHSDGVYLYKVLRKENPERVEKVLKLLEWNGGNASGIAISCVDNQGNVHPDQFWRQHSFGNVRERKFSEIWMDTSNPLMAGLKNRRYLLKGKCARCKYINICNGNFRARAEAVYEDLWAEDPACYLTEKEISN